MVTLAEHPRSPLRSAVVPGVVVLAGVATVVGTALAEDRAAPGSWWPAAGLGVVAVLLSPARRRPPLAGCLLVVLALAYLVAGTPATLAAVAALGDLVEVVAVVLLLRRLADERLDQLPHVAALVLAAVVGGLVAGGSAAVVRALDPDVGLDLAQTLTTVPPAHTASVLALAPVALLRWPPPPWRLRVDATLLGLLSAALLVAGFGPAFEGLTGLALTALPLPLLVWVALHLGLRVVVVHLVWLSLVLTTTALAFPLSFGVASNDAGATTVQVVQVYVICAALISLPLALVTQEREAAEQRGREGARTFRRAFTRSRLPVLLCRLEGDRLVVTEANHASGELLRRDVEALAGSDVEALLVSAELREELGRGAAAGEDGLDGWTGPMRLAEDTRLVLDGFCSLVEPGDRPARHPVYSLHLVDLTSHHELQARLAAERTYSRAVMDTASSLIVVTDDQGRIIAVNPATLRVSGYSEAELVGRALWDRLVPERNVDLVREALAHPPSLAHTGELALLARDGRERVLLYSHARHTDDAGTTVLVFSGTDVTDARESAGMVEHLLRSVTSLAFIGTDLAGAVTMFSSGAEQLLALTTEQARGRALTSLVAPVETSEEGAGATSPTFAQLCASDGPESAPGTSDWLALPEGRPPVQVSLTCSTVATDNGVATGHLFVARDVTETRRNQEILVNALRRERDVVSRLQALDRAKDDFVSTVSHELRTPMTSIIGSAEMLDDGLVGELSESQRQLVEVISRNGTRLLTLADDLLTLATFDREAWPGGGRALDLRDVVSDSLLAVRPQLDRTGVRHEVRLPETPVPVVGEANHLERAVTNLLTNACKFTAAGGLVGLSLTVDRSGHHAEVAVSDSGIGIAPKDLDHVLDRFFRSSDAQQRAIQGTGLGLSIVKSIVESHEGTVAVSSELGVGTTVTLCLPLSGATDPRSV